ncbi:DUF1735 and LamG domain-containing protein [Elizabethkingia meningoseptica]|uniref:DUF1735 and LamG domain-containing protein n=1 Tax=Elizabethkingia meningoseptica TaxID=238 RepID=UPI0023AF9514|nr:DUF1735 and LamG domain-containing protein [Elizabethkingia meningoseptica]MDE5493481.1 DUF1735 and LamG domain-containing protein [Elizabethkingia meningoseptica]
MKNLIYNITIVALILLLCKCTNEEPNVSENAIYFEGNLGRDFIDANIEQTETSIPISVRSAKPINNPVNVSVQVNNTAMELYNKKNSTEYAVLPQSYYIFQDTQLKIEKGKYISNPGILKIKDLTGLPANRKYAIPVTITNVSGEAPLLEASKTLYILIKRTITSQAASLNNNYFTVDFSKNNEGLNAMKTATYETRVFINSFQNNSPFISSIMGVEENFLLRFGDVTLQPSQLQVAGGNSTTAVGTPFSTGIWYHIAAVYDGNQLKIYVNGELSATKDAVRTIDLTNMWAGGFHIGYSAGGRLLDGAISEARIWSRPLSRNEIINGMCGVDPKNNGLISYWKFNESADGKTVKDLTGKGHDAVANNTITWIQGVKCSN